MQILGIYQVIGQMTLKSITCGIVLLRFHPKAGKVLKSTDLDK